MVSTQQVCGIGDYFLVSISSVITYKFEDLTECNKYGILPSHLKECIWISSNEMDETRARKPER